MHQQPTSPTFTRLRPKPPKGVTRLRIAAGIGALLLLAGGGLWALDRALTYEPPEVACGEFRVATRYWQTRDASDPPVQLDRRALQRQAAGVVRCVVRPGMSAAELRRQFGAPDDAASRPFLPEPSEEPQATPHVLRWTGESSVSAVNFYDGFDVWFDGPELERAVAIKLVHLRQDQ